MYSDALQNLQDLSKDDHLLTGYLEKLYLTWAEVEAYKIQDKDKVRDLMESYLKLNQNTHKLMSWANYIKLMRAFPDHDKALRGLFKRGLIFVKEGKATLAELWLEWEKK